jgi:hypothetical protein
MNTSHEKLQAWEKPFFKRRHPTGPTVARRSPGFSNAVGVLDV